MPEEFLRLLLGGVGWGLGTLFAGQGDIVIHSKKGLKTIKLPIALKPVLNISLTSDSVQPIYIFF